MKKTLVTVLVMLLVSVFFGYNTALAQNENTDLEVVATTGIFNAKIISQQENKFKLEFDLVNFTGVQPDVRYAVELRNKNKENEGAVIIDKKVYSDITTLEAEDVAHKIVVYEAPIYLNGEFEIWLSAENKNGFLLGVSDVEGITLKGNDKLGVNLDNSKCYLHVEKDELNLQYSLLRGVDVEKEEILKITCPLKNNTNQKKELNGVITTFRRTLFGDKINDTKNNLQKVVILPNEEKEVTFIVPTLKNSQAYSSVLTLIDAENKKQSNDVIFHWVLAGDSGTIQNVKLDKSSYEAGEEAQLSFMWSPAADNFIGARTETSNKKELDKKFFYSVIILSEGKICGEVRNSSLGLEDETIATLVAIKEKCVKPQLEVVLKDSNQVVLDSQKILMYDKTKNHSKLSFEESPTKTLEIQKRNVLNDKIVLVLMILSIISLIILIVWVVKFRKKPPISMIIFLGVLLSGMIFFSKNVSITCAGNSCIGAQTLKAQLKTARGNIHSTFAIVNLNRFRYNPGDKIKVSAIGRIITCRNKVYGSIYAKYLGKEKRVAYAATRGKSIAFLSGSTTFVAEKCGANGCGKKAITKIRADFHHADGWFKDENGKVDLFRTSGDEWQEVCNLYKSPKGKEWRCSKDTCTARHIKEKIGCWHRAYSKEKELCAKINCRCEAGCGNRATSYSATTTNYPTGSRWCGIGSSQANLIGNTFPQPGETTSWDCINLVNRNVVAHCSAIRAVSQQADCGGANNNAYKTTADVNVAGYCGKNSVMSDLVDNSGILNGLTTPAWTWKCNRNGKVAACQAYKLGECQASSGPYNNVAGACKFGSFNSVYLDSDHKLRWKCGTGDTTKNIGDFFGNNISFGSQVGPDYYGPKSGGVECVCGPVKYEYRCISTGMSGSCNNHCGESITEMFNPIKIDTNCFLGKTKSITRAEFLSETGNHCTNKAVACPACGSVYETVN